MMPLELPVLPVLERVMEASPCGDMTLLVTEFGKPFTPEASAIGSTIAASKPACPGRAHGVRKAGATIAAEHKATPHQLMAIFGWRTIKEAERYTRAAEQKRLAAARWR